MVIVEASPVLVLFMRDQFVLLVTDVSARDTVLPVIVGDCLVTDVAIPAEAKFITRVMLAVPAVLPVGCLALSAVRLSPVTDSVPTAEDVDRSWPDTNINGRSIPNKKYKVPMCPGIFAKKHTNNKTKQKSDMSN